MTMDNNDGTLIAGCTVEWSTLLKANRTIDSRKFSNGSFVYFQNFETLNTSLESFQLLLMSRA